jgi:hypothetical protein
MDINEKEFLFFNYLTVILLKSLNFQTHITLIFKLEFRTNIVNKTNHYKIVHQKNSFKETTFCSSLDKDC